MTIALVVLGVVVYVGVGMALAAEVWDESERNYNHSAVLGAIWPIVVVAFLVSPLMERMLKLSNKL